LANFSGIGRKQGRLLEMFRFQYFGFNVSIQPLAVEVASENFSAISSERIGPNLYFPPFMENDCGDSGKAEGFAYGLGLRF
jgi:hypothetical protein